ncbi:MAG: DNA polymerase III subunit delta, partial [Erythrobacter cryptus]
DHAAIGAATEEDSLAPLVNAVLGGELARIGGEVRRMRELALNPLGVVLALERRAAQLAQIAAKLGPQGRIQALSPAEKLQLGIFFREERAITQQFERWMRPAGRAGGETRLDRLIARLAMLHRTLLANSQAAELLLAQELAEIGRFAAKR